MFREKREKMQDLYSDLKKKQAFAEIHAKNIFLHAFMKTIAGKFSNAKLEKTKHLKAVFLTLRIRQMWKRRNKRWNQRAEAENEFKKKSRFIFTCTINALEKGIYAEARKIFL